MTHAETRYAVPGWGRGVLWTRDGVVCAHEFSFDPHPGRASASGPAEGLRLAGRLAAFLRGEDELADVPLDLSWCTPFQRAVALALRAVPRGEVVTYGELAALAGHPGAQRAVGTFCARNRFAFLVPCHRVVGADGIGSYGATGVAAKRRLLAAEGVRL
ncbi:MAG TPA: methylated-DNA--[protein]-cysteine S-methyltransferase [Gaiellaceae bacterium]|nr:methylated-DNA--[protein]-cysteine S-methyltransferase [Gaiellaceae bacterium]